MKRYFLLAAWAALLAFAGLTLWSVTVRGAFEQPRLDVEHFDAGAGDVWLIVRAGLAVATTVLLGISAVVAPSVLARACRAVVALLPVPIFLWSCIGVERWGPRYTEAAFAGLAQRFRESEPLTEEKVIEAVGRPLFTTVDPDGSGVWSYSFMPSSGFGWHKRILHFRGDTVSAFRYWDEP